MSSIAVHGIKDSALFIYLMDLRLHELTETWFLVCYHRSVTLFDKSSGVNLYRWCVMSQHCGSDYYICVC